MTKIVNLTLDRRSRGNLKKLAKSPGLLKTTLRKAGYDIGSLITKDIKKGMTHGVKTGRVYKKYVGIGGKVLVKPRLYTASAKNEDPAVITGSLRSSVGFKVQGHDKIEIGAGNGQVRYARVLELGGRNLSQRKYLYRGIQNNKLKSKSILATRVNQALP